MILWTIQTREAWQQLQSCGVLRGRRERIVEQSWQGPYQWMIEQMKRRIGSPPSPAAYPIWAWFQWENAKRARPDLRANGHFARGVSAVRIEFECSDAVALLSDFDLWHYILNYWYLPASEAEGEQFEAELARQGLSFFETKPLTSPEYHQRIVKSWQKIFDLHWTEDNRALPRNRKSIQATLWEITTAQVRDHTHFRAR